MKMRRSAPNSYWLRWRDVGIRCFPRCGSSTMQATYGRAHDFGLFIAAPKRVVVVRSPLHRLGSVYYGMVVHLEKFNGYALPKGISFTEFVEWLIEQDPFECDTHVAPQWAHLQGYFEPRDDELITMEDFFRAPPHGIPAFGYKPIGEERDLDMPDELYDRWCDWGARKDYNLYHRAKKSPLVTGGEAGTTDDRP